MPRFLHTSDLHLNALRRFNQFYLDRAKRVLQSILRVAKNRGVDFIIVAGDVYDRRDITHLERQLVTDWLGASPIPILSISGNHDKRSAAVGDTCLSYLSGLGSELSLHEVYDGTPTILKKFGCSFILLPYQGWTDQELFLILDTLVPRASADPDRPVIAVMHEAVQGCTNDVGLTITKSNQIRIDTAFPQIDYWALGDMHIQQQIADNAFYCGAPYQTRFDELPNKGVLIVDTDDPGNPEFVEVPSSTLDILTDEPDDWPSPLEALVQFRPDGQFPAISMPTNVEFHPSIVVPSTENSGGPLRDSIGIFDGLESHLARLGLRPELFPLAWQTAIRLAANLGVEVELPEKYQVDTEDDVDE